MRNKYETKGEDTTIFVKRKDGTEIKTLISTSDLGKVDSMPNTWTATWSPITKSFYIIGYVGITLGKQKNVALHRFITDAEKGLMVDHKNRDTLDNTRNNLRVTNGSVNQLNKATRGVYFNEKYQKWNARVQVKGKRMSLGMFDDEEKALQAAKKAREEAIAAAM